jgi:hypothetical protein
MIALSSGSKNLVGKAAFVPEDSNEGFGGFCGVIRLIDPDLRGFVCVYLQADLHRESIPIRDTAWKAQERPYQRYRKLIRAGKLPSIATAVIARELVGFVWAIAKQLQPNRT